MITVNLGNCREYMECENDCFILEQLAAIALGWAWILEF